MKPLKYTRRSGPNTVEIDATVPLILFANEQGTVIDTLCDAGIASRVKG